MNILKRSCAAWERRFAALERSCPRRQWRRQCEHRRYSGPALGYPLNPKLPSTPLRLTLSTPYSSHDDTQEAVSFMPHPRLCGKSALMVKKKLQYGETCRTPLQSKVRKFYG